MKEDRKERELWKARNFGNNYGRPTAYNFLKYWDVAAAPQKPLEGLDGPQFTYRCVRERTEFTELEKCKACPKCGGPVQLVKKRKR